VTLQSGNILSCPKNIFALQGLYVLNWKVSEGWRQVGIITEVRLVEGDVWVWICFQNVLAFMLSSINLLFLLLLSYRLNGAVSIDFICRLVGEMPRNSLRYFSF